MPNIERLKADSASRTSYQVDDLARKRNAENGRVENRRVHSQQIIKRIQDRDKVQEQRYENRLHSKAATNMIYEHVGSELPSREAI